MLAVRWHARGDVRVEEVPPPAPPGPGEVQLRVRWCGICGTDLEEWLAGPVFIPAAVPHPLTGARAPLILGHEFAGVVVAAGAGVTGPLPGQRVAVDTIVSCGSCHWCRRGEVTRCPALGALGLHADGGLAELCNAPARMCLPVPDTVADDAAALAEPLAVAVRALRRGGLRPGERVAVVGAGTVGLMTVQAAAALGSLSHVWDQDFREALQLLGGGAVQAATLITDRIPLGAAVAGGLALLRDEPERHLKILAGQAG